MSTRWLDAPATPGYWWRRSPHHAPALCRVDLGVSGFVARDAHDEDQRYPVDDLDARWCRAEPPADTDPRDARIAALTEALRKVLTLAPEGGAPWVVAMAQAQRLLDGGPR